MPWQRSQVGSDLPVVPAFVEDDSALALLGLSDLAGGTAFVLLFKDVWLSSAFALVLDGEGVATVLALVLGGVNDGSVFCFFFVSIFGEEPTIVSGWLRLLGLVLTSLAT